VKFADISSKKRGRMSRKERRKGTSPPRIVESSNRKSGSSSTTQQEGFSSPGKSKTSQNLCAPEKRTGRKRGKEAMETKKKGLIQRLAGETR